MTAVATPRIVEALAVARILDPDQLDELVGTLLPRCADWAILGPELVFRGWLTPYQSDAVRTGRDLALGNYVLLEEIGEGGMGRIYLARHRKLGTPAAVKVIRTERAADPGAVGRFLREIRALGAGRHPGLVHAFDADLDRGRLYIAMEYVPGLDLERLIERSGPLPIDSACRYATEVADALQYISTLGLVHRDVKPANILVPSDGGSVKLVDLGLARFDSGDGAAGLTRVGVMVGTPDYASPEQIRDSHVADIRSDLYSLGCTLYQMLGGRPPFYDRAPVDKMYHHLCVDPVPVEVYRPDVPAALATVVRTLLAKRPRDRYQEPAELAAALRGCRHRAGDTVTGSGSPTVEGVPTSSADWALPKTAEIPLDQLRMVTGEEPVVAAVEPARFQRVPWYLAAALAGLALGLLLTRG